MYSLWGHRPDIIMVLRNRLEKDPMEEDDSTPFPWSKVRPLLSIRHRDLFTCRRR